jgi:hypothetical protein
MKQPKGYRDGDKEKEKEGGEDEHPDRGICGAGAPAKMGGYSR